MLERHSVTVRIGSWGAKVAGSTGLACAAAIRVAAR